MGWYKKVLTLRIKEKVSPNSLKLSEHSIKNKTSIAETSKFFINIGLNLVSNIPKLKNLLNSFLKSRVINSSFLNLAKETEIVELFCNLSPNKNLGSHRIPKKNLENHLDSFQPPLTHLTNLSS